MIYELVTFISSRWFLTILHWFCNKIIYFWLICNCITVPISLKTLANYQHKAINLCSIPVLSLILEISQWFYYGLVCIEQDLKFLSDNLEGRSSHPVSLLFDTLSNPDADIGIESPSLLHWKHDSKQEISHVVLGKKEEGGIWQASLRVLARLRFMLIHWSVQIVRFTCFWMFLKIMWAFQYLEAHLGFFSQISFFT